MDNLPSRLNGLHHITLTSATAQSDINFFVKILGQKLVKRTLLYDGGEPIYHLYFGNSSGDPGTLTTTFPMRRLGRNGRLGAGQISSTNYAIPVGSSGWWKEHLRASGIDAIDGERFGERFLRFKHPECSLGFEVVETGAPAFAPHISEYVPVEHATRGFHSWTCTVNELEDMHDFLECAWSMRKVGEDGGFHRYQMGEGGPSRFIDLDYRPGLRQGTWNYAEGIAHHGAFDVADLETQAALKFDVEGLGFTDFSDRKHRGYFESIYIRTPGGMLFEATKTIGFTVDEDAAHLGEELKVSPQFQDLVPELLERMNDPIEL